MFFKKLNNAGLWDKIQKLRELIKAEKYFKKRTCWNCNKDLNIYDFLSDNIRKNLENLQKTKVLYMIGDVKNDIYRQTATAIGDGIKSAMEIHRKIKEE